MRTTPTQQRRHYLPPFTPSFRAVNMRSVQTFGSTQFHLPLVSPACLALPGTPAGCPSLCLPKGSRFHLPASLRSTPITALLRYYEGSDSCTALSTAQVSLLHVHSLLDHSISNHPVPSYRRFRTLPLSSIGLPLPQVQTSPFPSRLVRNTRPNRVRHPMDWSFTSCCSPPHLSVTQLHSVTDRRAYA